MAADPVTHTDLDEAYRANAMFDAHRDDLEFGYRFSPTRPAPSVRPGAGS